MEFNHEPSLRELILRSPMLYLGRELDNDGLHRLVFEVVKLAVEPESLNECTQLTMTLTKTGAIVITDNGRGIPVSPISIDNSRERPRIEHVLTWFLTTNSNHYYHENYGYLNHLGGVINAVSKELTIDTTRNNTRYRIVCSQGKVVKPLHIIAESAEKGTRIAFLPDDAVFENPIFDAKKLIQRLSQLSIQYTRVKFEFQDENTHDMVSFPLMQ